MKFTSNSSSKTFENPEAGTYPAVCIRLIDMGTQESTWQGEKKASHKVKLVFELAELMSDGRPFIAMRDFTVSMHEKSSLRQFLAGWRGRDFSDEELKGFEAKKLIGQGCLLSLVQNGEYININTASKLPKGMSAPSPVNPLVYFSLEEFDKRTFDSLSDKLKEKIAQSPEFKRVSKGVSPDDFNALMSDLEEEAF
jgi:hypothetical protein